MNATNKALLKSAMINGLLWTGVLLLLSYFKNGLINTNYAPLWLLFFAGTGAIRKYYSLKNSK